MANHTIDKFKYGSDTFVLQDNVSGYTTNTGTVTSVGITNDTNGGLSVSGSPVTVSGSITIGHSNVLTNAQTTQAVYPIKIDKNGHISGYGSAVTITDEKLKTSALGVSTTTYYPVLTTDASAAETKKYSTLLQARYKDSNYDIFNLRVGNGVGVKGRLQLSNSGSSGDFTTLTPNATGDTAITLPATSGTLALTSDIPTVPTISLNGSTTTSPSFYAPTSAGTSGYVLTSSGGGAPEWAAIPSDGITDVTVNGTSVVTDGVAEIDLSSYVAKDGSGNVSIPGSLIVEGHDSAIGEIKSATESFSISSGTTWTNRNSGIALTLSPGTWLVTAYASCPGSTAGDRGLGITYGSSTGNLAQSRVTQRANSGSSIATMQTTMAVATNTSNRTYTIEYWQNSNSNKTVEFRLNAVRIA